MSFEIEIIEGHIDGGYFWFRPVILNEKGEITDDNIIELEETISIDDLDVSNFLLVFLIKHFNRNLSLNVRREDYGYRGGDFDPNLTHNFYTYDIMTDLINDIIEVSSLLEKDFDNPKLDDIKKGFSIFSMCSMDDEDYINRNHNAIQKHISVVIDFYKRFVERITMMMKNNTETNVISVMGP